MGPANVVTIYIEGKPTQALMDTGSMVSTISEDYCIRHLPNHPITPLAFILNITSATGHQLPYSGVIEVQLRYQNLHGVAQEKNVLMLVVPGEAWKAEVPALVGTNILNSDQEVSESAQIGVRTTEAIKVSPGSLQPIQGALTANMKEGNLFVTDCGDRSSLPSGLRVVPALLSPKAGSVCCSIRNFSTEVVEIPQGTLLCGLQSVHEVVPRPAPSGESKVPSAEFKSVFDLSHVAEEGKREELGALLEKWREVFALSDFELGRTEAVKHKIELTEDNPMRQRYRRIPPGLYDEVRKHLRMMLEAGVIRPSQSAWRSPVVLVRKKDQSLRFCVDYRSLNAVTRKDAQDIPRIEETLDHLHGAQFFSCLDLKSGYWQVEIEEEHKPLTAFSVGPLGFYEFNVMPFGLTNSPATFQRLMERCMGDLHLSQCLVYLDDIIVFSQTFEDHLVRLGAVFERLKSFGLKLKPSKCQFLKDKVKYLGHVVSKSGVEVDPEKVEVLSSMAPPKNINELQQFLGFVGFNRRFVANFSSIVSPLNQLLKKEAAFEWTSRQQDAFETIIAKLTSAPVLGFADFSQPFILHVDASTTGLGAMLSQEQEGGRRVIAYGSRSLNPAEQRYPAHKLEFLALKWSVCERFHDYLYGQKFKVVTDNNPLTYVLTSAKLDAAGHRWAAALATYDFSLSYLPGKQNTAADFLSRMHSNEEVRAVLQGPLRPEEGYAMSLRVAPQVMAHLVESPSVQKLDVAAHQEEDKSLGRVMTLVREGRCPGKKLRKKEIPEVRKLLSDWDKLRLVEGVLKRVVMVQNKETEQTVVPTKLRAEVLRALHDDMGHPGRDRTAELLHGRFFWPGWRQDVVDKVERCKSCVCRKARPHQAPMHPIVSSHPLDLVCMDYLSLEASQGYSNILVITDHFTKFATAIPTRNQTARTTARVLYEGFIVRYGIPSRLHSDQGANFLSNIMRELSTTLGVERSRTTPYHPMGNGACERVNQTLLGMLGCLEEEKKKSWSKHLATLVHCYNCTPHSSTGHSPYELMFGRTPNLPVDIRFGAAAQKNTENRSEYVKNLRESLHESWELASRLQMKASEAQKEVYDQKQRGALLRTGDAVLVKKLHFKDGPHKLEDRWEKTPHIIVRQPDPDIPVYVVALEEGPGRKRTLHRNLLLPLSHRWWPTPAPRKKKLLPAPRLHHSVGDAPPEAGPSTPRTRRPPAARPDGELIPQVAVDYDSDSDTMDSESLLVVPHQESVSHQVARPAALSPTPVTAPTPPPELDDASSNGEGGLYPVPRRSTRVCRPPLRYRDLANWTAALVCDSLSVVV